MSLQPRARVHASHDIQRGPHQLVKRGARGMVLDTHPHWKGGSYTVEFESTDKKHPRPTVVGLTDGDVEPDWALPAEADLHWLVTFKRGDNVKAVRDLELGQDVVIRTGCPGRIAQRMGTLNHKYVVLFTSRDDIAENEIIVKGLVDADLEYVD